MPAIPYEVIQEAMQENEQALAYILKIFNPYITRLATNAGLDMYGRRIYSVDEELAAYMRSTLVLSITQQFKILTHDM